MADDLAGERALAVGRAAELADEPLPARLGERGQGGEGRGRVEMHLLAGQRRAPAVGATLAVGRQRSEASAEEEHLQLLDGAF